MFIEMGMFMAKDAYGAPPDLSENMFSNFESTEEYQVTCQECQIKSSMVKIFKIHKKMMQDIIW